MSRLKQSISEMLRELVKARLREDYGDHCDQCGHKEGCAHTFPYMHDYNTILADTGWKHQGDYDIPRTQMPATAPKDRPPASGHPQQMSYTKLGPGAPKWNVEKISHYTHEDGDQKGEIILYHNPQTGKPGAWAHQMPGEDTPFRVREKGIVPAQLRSHLTLSGYRQTR